MPSIHDCVKGLHDLACILILINDYIHVYLEALLAVGACSVGTNDCGIFAEPGKMHDQEHVSVFWEAAVVMYLQPLA